MLGFDVHLQTVAARGPVPTLLTHKQLFSTMLKSLVQLQFRPRQEALGTRGALQAVETGRGAVPGEDRAGLPGREPQVPSPAWSGAYRMGLRGSVQLDHVTLQVLLLHELLGAGGALQGQAQSAPHSLHASALQSGTAKEA